MLSEIHALRLICIEVIDLTKRRLQTELGYKFYMNGGEINISISGALKRDFQYRFLPQYIVSDNTASL